MSSPSLLLQSESRVRRLLKYLRYGADRYQRLVGASQYRERDRTVLAVDNAVTKELARLVGEDAMLDTLGMEMVTSRISTNIKTDPSR